MTYLTITHIPGGELSGFQAILAALPDTQPNGLVARYVGQADDEFVITAVWTSKASWDRFATEVLGPAARCVAGPSHGPVRTVEYETGEELVVGPPSAR